MAPDTLDSQKQDLDQPVSFAAVDEEVQQPLVAGEDQQESTVPNLEQQEIRSTPMVHQHNIFRALGKSKKLKPAVQPAGSHHAEGETSSMGRVKFGLSRLFKR